MPQSKRRLTPAESLVLACARQSPRSEHQQTVSRLVGEGHLIWESVYDTASQHGVAPLVYANLLRFQDAGLSLPEAILERFRLNAARNAIHKKRQAGKLIQALRALREYDVDVMLVKGAALDVLVYQEPWYTAAYDIDLVLRPTRAELEARGLAHLIPKLEGYGIEYDYFTHHDIVMNGTLPVDFHRIWQDAVSGEYNGEGVYLMSPEDMLIALCINSCRKRFFRLKSICDLAETVAKFDEIDWTLVVIKARQYQVLNIVYAALRVAESTLGCGLPEELFEALSVRPLRRRLIDFLIRRMSLSAYASMLGGANLLQRSVAWQLILPYATFRWDQISRRLRFVWRTRALKSV